MVTLKRLDPSPAPFREIICQEREIGRDGISPFLPPQRVGERSSRGDREGHTANYVNKVANRAARGRVGVA